MFEAPKRLLHEGLIHAAKNDPDKVVAIVEGVSYSYRDLEERSARLSSVLVGRGVVRGDRVAIFMDNTWHCIVSIYAVLRAGAAFMLINPQTKYDKLVYVLNDSGAEVLLSDAQLHSTLNAMSGLVPSCVQHVLVVGDLELVKLAGVSVEDFDAAVRMAERGSDKFVIPSDLCALIYTSGSTGNPKGVMHTHLSMVYALNSIVEYLRLSENDRILNVLPMAFDYGLYQLLMTVWLGATLVLERSFTYPAVVLNRVNEFNVSVFPGVPTIYSMLIAQYLRKPFTLDSVTRITNTAAALPKNMLDPLKKIFPNALVFKMYGLTECKRVSYLEPELIESHGDSVGKAIPGTEAFLVSSEGIRLPLGSEGILHVRGPHVMLGYWNQPEQTEHMLKSYELPGERVLCTHDVFRMDKDGFLYFVGRTDDIIKSRGEKVSPLEVEKTLLTMPGVDEAAVIGVPDKLLGQAIVAFVTQHKEGQLNEALLKKTCLMRLENYMVPKRILIIDAMPKSPNGKIDKKQLFSMVD